MMKKQKTIRIAVSSALLLTVVAAGVTLYRTGTITEQTKDNRQEEQQMEEDTSLSEMAQAEEMTTQEDTANVNTNQAVAENTEDIQEQEALASNENLLVESGSKENPTAETSSAATEENSAEETLADASPVLNFSDESTILWPVGGEIIIDYSMDATTYFPTLDQYKYNSAVMLDAEVGDPVQAAATGTVLSIYENEETGSTMTVDLGNGYQAVYGQLKDIRAEVGQTVEAGTIIGYINEPTKYYVEEGANLYFAMTKDEAPVDPMIYMETVTE
ncbi:MAG: M23 family metallopeptidase [Ruminococcus sp.]|nr:M23 family metallopeptidase [Ruminococcus sp.]